MSIHDDPEKNCTLFGTAFTVAVMATTISLILSLFSIVGNILIILAVVLDPNKNLRTPFNWLLVNLAVADLVTGTVTDPISVSVHLKLCLGKQYSEGEMRVLHMSYFISCTVSALSISSLAVERYLAVRKPNTYRNKMTNKRIIVTVAAIWLISLTLPNVYFEVGYTLYSLVFANAPVFLATSITCFSCILIRQKIKRRSQTIANRNRAVALFSSTETRNHQNSFTARNTQTTPNSMVTNANKMEEKVTKMFLVVLIAMFCCYGPATLFIYLMNVCESCGCVAQHWFQDLAFVLIVINSSLNFCCYAMQSSRFRRAFIKIIKIGKKNHHHKTFPKNRKAASKVTAEQREDVQMQEIVGKPDADNILE